MKLYLIHCGFYDKELTSGVYEFHINIPVVAQDLEGAKKKVREEPSFILKKMHIDGIQEIQVVNGHQITVEKISELEDQNQIENICHRDL